MQPSACELPDMQLETYSFFELNSTLQQNRDLLQDNSAQLRLRKSENGFNNIETDNFN